MVDEFKKDILSLDIRDVYHKYILGSSVWYFDEYLGVDIKQNVYDSFRSYVANKFELSFNNVGVAGSAKTGFSLSPTQKLYRPFSEGRLENEKPSDIDLILVSKEIFEQYWNAYRNKLYSKKWINDFNLIKHFIFKKILIFNGFNEHDEEYREWLKKTSDFQKEVQDLFRIRHAVNYFIFESWDAVEQYYIGSLFKIKNKENPNG